MLRQLLAVAGLLGAALQAGAQAVTEWRTESGLPVAVVEVAGGDVEHLAVFLAAGVEPPSTLAGFPLVANARRGGTVVVLTVPASLAPAIAKGAAEGLAGVGGAAFVALGPAPARELLPARAALDAVPHRLLPRAACPLAEGGVELRRGSPERFELHLAAPGVDDPRFELVPALAGWLVGRLGREFPSLRTDLESAPCPRLVLRAEAGNEHPRVTVTRLREALAALALAVPTDEEAARAGAAARRSLAAVFLDGRAAARELVSRLAAGGRVASGLLAPHVDPPGLAALARDVLAGHSGFAVLVEQERRGVTADHQTLENGVLLAWRWVAADTGSIAVAVGPVRPDRSRAVLEAAAAAAADRGWAAEVTALVGVQAVAVVVPGTELDDALEVLGESMARGAGGAAPATPAEELAASFGLDDEASADTMSVALALPEDAESGHEAAVKFFSGLPAGAVRSSGLGGPGGLAWSRGPGPPRLAAAVELPATTAGLVAGEVLVARLAGTAGAAWLPLPGRLVLAVTAEGGASVPELDAKLAAALAAAVAAVPPADTAAAAGRVAAALFGDAARATARDAAAPFLLDLPRQEELLAADPAEVSGLLAALPRWPALTRVASGPAPLEPGPTPAVRKSPPRRL